MFLSDPPENDAVHALYEASRLEDGYVTNFLRVWGWRPDVFCAFREMRTSLASRTTLSEREIAVLNATTASRLGDGYCSIAWGSRLAKLTTPAVAASLLRAEEQPPLSGRETALMHWAAAMLADPNATTRKSVESLKSAGLDEQEIFDATLLVAFRLAFSTVNDALGATPDRGLVEAAPAEVTASVTYGRSLATSSE